MTGASKALQLGKNRAGLNGRKLGKEGGKILPFWGSRETVRINMEVHLKIRNNPVERGKGEVTKAGEPATIADHIW